MKPSTTSQNSLRPGNHGSSASRTRAARLFTRVLAVAFWLVVWQILSAVVGQEILLVSPVTAFLTLMRLMGTLSFYQSIVTSFGRILLGFVMALTLGVALSALAKRLPFVRELLSPLMATVKSTPVASFVILALVWLRHTANLSVLTSFMMVLPIIYANVLSGLDHCDEQLLEMARAFRMPSARRIRALYAPAAFPYLLTACQIGLGMCWKAGIAAEVIGQPARSIGERLYRAKVFLSTDELFAWTLAIILLSVLLERLSIALIKRLQSVYVGGEPK